MKAPVNSMYFSAMLIILGCILSQNLLSQDNFKTFIKKSSSILVSKSTDYRANFYDSGQLDYHAFKLECQGSNGELVQNWYEKYKLMFDFQCKEPFYSNGVRNNTTGYLFRLVDNQQIEDSIAFLKNKYFYNSNDTLRKWNLPLGDIEQKDKKIIKRLGLNHFKFINCVFEHKKYLTFIEVPEAEQANDNMVFMHLFKYPADVDIFIYDFMLDNWVYVESVTVSGDHELELYVLTKFEPRYLFNCNLSN